MFDGKESKQKEQNKVIQKNKEEYVLSKSNEIRYWATYRCRCKDDFSLP